MSWGEKKKIRAIITATLGNIQVRTKAQIRTASIPWQSALSAGVQLSFKIRIEKKTVKHRTLTQSIQLLHPLHRSCSENAQQSGLKCWLHTDEVRPWERLAGCWSSLSPSDTQRDATPSLTTTLSCCIETEHSVSKYNGMKALEDLLRTEKRLAGSRQHL